MNINSLASQENRTFTVRLFRGLLDSSLNYEKGNWDFVRYRFNRHTRWRLWLEDQLNYVLARLGRYGKHYDEKNASAWLDFVVAHLDDFELLYQQLTDLVSRDLLVDVIKFQILGKHHVRLPANNVVCAQANAKIKQNMVKQKAILLGNYPRALNRYRLDGRDGTLHLHGDSFTLRNTFLLNQYRYSTDQVLIEAGLDQVVLDGGGCWGDTAIYFAERVGDAGRVFSFEFDAQNLQVFQKNLEENPRLAPRIQIVPQALWETSNHSIGYVAQRGAATALDPNVRDGNQVKTVAIDDWARQSGLRVDFIKLDIEGAELRALRGAEWTIRTFRPTLAICLYHSMSDFVEIPRYLLNLNLGYQFYLGHVTIYHEETVLFATRSHDTSAF